ncbi:MAG: class I SAM-dependent methyltransferase [Firmicutes bacterium]|nr:class I SAM-dependent methyltransferase [Bacillota bacterium]
MSPKESSRRCPLCTAQAQWEMTQEGRDFYRCDTCALTFVPREQHLDAAEEKRRYSQHQNTIDNPGYVKMFTDKFPLLRKYCSDVKRILDYGCGPGPVLVELLRREGYEAIGYDPYFAPEVDLSRPFDLIISTEAFEHFADPRKEMERIAGLVTSHGYLAIMTRQRSEAVDLQSWWYVRDPTHVTFYAPRTFDWMAQYFGYRVLYQDRTNFVILQKVPSVGGSISENAIFGG